MADICCDTIIAGLFFLTIGDRTFQIMGRAEIRPGGVERTADATSSGRMYATEKAVLTEADITFANFCDADPMLVFRQRCKIQATLVEDGRGFRHMFTDAVATGRPVLNLATGEVTGIQIRTDKYNVLDESGGVATGLSA